MGQESQLSDSSVRVYRYRRDTRMVLAWLLVFVVAALAWAAWTHHLPTLIFFGAFTPVYIWGVARYSGLYLVVAPDSITYVNGTYVLSARWQNVVGIGKAPRPWYGWGDGLLLDHYGWRPTGFWGRFRRQAPGYIPIRFWTGWSCWDDGPDQELQRHIPWLIYPAPQSVAAAPPPTNR